MENVVVMVNLMGGLAQNIFYKDADEFLAHNPAFITTMIFDNCWVIKEGDHSPIGRLVVLVKAGLE